MTRCIQFASFIWVNFALNSLAFGQSSEIIKDFKVESSKSVSTFEAMNRIVENRALASGLASGVNSLNRTVDSLMEALFYSVMDQAFKSEFSDNVALSSSYQREVHGTSIGSYAVIDTFRLGPDFFKDLGKIKGLPLTFSNQTNLFITNANLRSDAQRKAEGQRNGFWRELLNNWIGIVPFLTTILPPSFNPEELYDPLGYLATPFLFPRDVTEALEMPLGTVRSYGLAGTTQFSIDLKGRVLGDLQETLNFGDLDLKVPFSLFRDGEHRISILRRDENEVWLALSEVRRMGQSINFDLRKNYSALQQLVKWWTGLPILIAPIDFGLQNAENIRMDELFGFDLREKKAQEAFTKALHGDFQPARDYGEKAKSEVKEHGVHFHFRRFSTKSENGLRQGRSFYVAQSQRQSLLGAGETHTIDNQGEFYTLDAEFLMQDRDWDVLVGPETTEFRHRLSIPVRKERTENDKERYVLATDAENPLYMTATLKLADDFVDTLEVQNIEELFRLYSGLPLEELPRIPIRAKDVEAKLLSQQAFANPMDEIKRRELTPTHLGKLAGYAHLYFSHDLMLAIARLPIDQLWNSLAVAFKVDPLFWSQEAENPGFSYYANWFGSYLVSPLRLMNIQGNFPDLVLEARRLKSAFWKLPRVTEPLAILDVYRQILDTTHPAQLIRTFVQMSRGLPLPIAVGFTANPQAKGDDSPDVKNAKVAFGKFDDRVFSSPWPIPSLKRDQSVEEKLAHFDAGGHTSSKSTPLLSRLSLHLDAFIVDSEGHLFNLLVADFTARNPPRGKDPLHVYLRVEQHSPLNLGRFVLGEELVEVKPLSLAESTTGPSLLKDDEPSTTYRLSLNGPQGLKNSGYLDEATLKGASLDFIVSVSENGEDWSPEQTMSFRVENGLLTKL